MTTQEFIDTFPGIVKKSASEYQIKKVNGGFEIQLPTTYSIIQKSLAYNGFCAFIPDWLANAGAKLDERDRAGYMYHNCTFSRAWL